MKKMFATLLFGSVLAAAALAVPAQGSGGVTLSASSGGAQVSLEMPADTVQDVTTMHMSFVISSDANISANFDFNDALKSSVQESRYENGRLDVYVSGSQNIFADGTLNLGEILLTTADGTAAQATVSVEGDSIELLNAAYGSPELPEIAPVEAEVSVSGTNSGSGGDTGDNSGSGGDTGNNSGDNGGSGNHSGSGNSSNSGNGSNGSQSTTAQSETSGVTGGTSVTTPATQNGGSSSSQSGSSNKGNSNKGSSATATPDPESTPSPEEETSRPDSTENTKPEDQTEATSTPEQATDEQQQSSGFPLMLIVAVIAVLAIAAGVIIFIRRRS